MDYNTTTLPPDSKVEEQRLNDIKNFEAAEQNKASFNMSSVKRLILSELSYKGAFKRNKICGFTKNQIMQMVQYPENYGDSIIRLSRYMMLKSGYYKRLVEYFVNMATMNWTVDTIAKDSSFLSLKPDTIKKNYIKYAAQIQKFNLENRITDIFRRLFVDDVCFAFLTENDIECSIFFLDPKYCEIKKLINGNVFEFAINRSLLNAQYFDSLPSNLQLILQESENNSLNNMVMIPYENSLCLKYHTEFTYLYPPFFYLIADILLIDDYKDLAKAKTESDAYKLIYFKIPTEDGKITMNDELVIPFVETCKQIVPDIWGVVPSPMEIELIESKSTASDDDDKTENAINSYYAEAGVSKSVISSASSGSELKYSIKVDSSDVVRIYRQIESWVTLQMRLRGFIYKSYDFIFNILPLTIFDIDDYIDKQLKLSQASVPNKGKLLAANGINTAKLIGNTFMENYVLRDLFDSFTPLKTSYTQSADSDNVGRPEMAATEISEVTEVQRENGSNSTENRI